MTDPIRDDCEVVRFGQLATICSAIVLKSDIRITSQEHLPTMFSDCLFGAVDTDTAAHVARQSAAFVTMQHKPSNIVVVFTESPGTAISRERVDDLIGDGSGQELCDGPAEHLLALPPSDPAERLNVRVHFFADALVVVFVHPVRRIRREGVE